MFEARTRIVRELFLFGFGGNVDQVEPWVIDRLTSFLFEENAAAGSTLFRPGELADSFHFVRRGRLRVTVGSEAEGRASQEIDGPRVIGALDAFLERPRTQTALALTPLEVMAVDVQNWFQLLDESFDLARMTTRGLARRALQLRSAQSAIEAAAAPPGARTATCSPPLDLVERTALLMKTPPLRGAGVSVAGEIASRACEVVFDAGAALHRPGQPRDRILVVVEGVAEATFERPRVVVRADRGGIVGWPAIYDDAVECEARATTALRALAVGFDDWNDVMEAHFAMVRSALSALAHECDTIGE